MVIEHGQIELEHRCGDRRRFGRGDVLWLDGLRVRSVRNCDTEPAVLVAVSRQTSWFNQ
ncbi:MAG: hypothetical protein ACR2M3_19430 [Thermomicrobiales bacterium]